MLFFFSFGFFETRQKKKYFCESHFTQIFLLLIIPVEAAFFLSNLYKWRMREKTIADFDNQTKMRSEHFSPSQRLFCLRSNKHWILFIAFWFHYAHCFVTNERKIAQLKIKICETKWLALTLCVCVLILCGFFVLI